MRLIRVLYAAHYRLCVKFSGEIQGCKTHLADFGAKFDRNPPFFARPLKSQISQDNF